MHITLTTTEVLFLLSTIVSFIGSYIIIARQVKQRTTSFDFTLNHYLIGIISSVMVCIGLVNWTTTDAPVRYYEVKDIPEETLIQPPTSDHPKKIVPPPAPPKTTKTSIPKIIKDILLDETNEDPKTEDIIEDLSEDVVSPSVPLADTAASPAPIVAPIIESKDDEVVLLTDEMPRFPGCEEIAGTKMEKEKCAKEKLLEYVYNNLRYPQVAIEVGLEGLVVVQFVVTKTGDIEQIEVVRDIGGGCGDVAKKIVTEMNSLPEKWRPGKQHGRPVNVRYTLPIKYQLH